MTSSLTLDDVVAGQEITSTVYNLTLHRLILHAAGNRDFTPLHYDDGTAQAGGARGAFINNVFCIGMWERTVRDFVGPGGVIHAIRGLRMSSFNVVGDSLVTDGHVERVWTEHGVDFAEISIHTTNTTTNQVTVGPGSVLVSLPAARTMADRTHLRRRFEVANQSRERQTQRRKISAPREVSPQWSSVARLKDVNLLLVPSLPGVDRVEPSVVRRLCEPLELHSTLHHDPELARSWGFDTAVAPICGVGTTYVDPGSWRHGDGTQYPTAGRDEPPARANGVETGSHTTKLPVPDDSVGILTEVGLELYAPVHVGDLLSVRSIRLTTVVPKRTSVGGGAFLTFVNEIWNERRHVATVTKVGFHYQPTVDSSTG